jgi:hypothetical protein
MVTVCAILTARRSRTGARYPWQSVTGTALYTLGG